VGPLGDRLHHRDLIDAALERQRLGLAQRRRAGQEERGHAVEMRVGDGGDAVGEARPRGHERDARPTRGARPAVRGMARRLLVARVDEADVAAGGRHVDGVQVPAVEREDGVDARALQHADQQLATVDLRHAVLPGSRRG
jgi:hypothetical protein